MNYDLELEDAVIGGLLLEPHWLSSITNVLKPEIFYSDDNKRVYAAILDLDKKGLKIDIMSVSQVLMASKFKPSNGSNAAYFVSLKTNRVASSENILTHVLLLTELHLKREFELVAIRMQNEAKEPIKDVFELIGRYSKTLTNLLSINNGNVKHISEVATGVISEAKTVLDNGLPSGFPTGFVNLDRKFSKQRQDLGILAARPGMGKTAFMLNLAINTAKRGEPVLIHSLEMSAAQLVGRIMSILSRVPSKAINEKSINSGQLMSLGSIFPELENLPIYIDDTPAISIDFLRNSVRLCVSKYGIKEVYVDYLQLMSGNSKGNRENEISSISRGLKSIAKSENLPITALSQLSRKVEERPNKMPMLSDLRESGAIEQDADWVQFLYRPEYYGETEYPETFSGQQVDVRDLLIVNQAKYRGGNLFECPLKFYGEFMTVSNYNLDGFNDFGTIQQNNDFLTN